jgi:hypothetical protein
MLLKQIWDRHGLRRLFLIFFTVTFFYTTGTRDKAFEEILLPDFALSLAGTVYRALETLLLRLTDHPHAFDILWGLTATLVLLGYTILFLVVLGLILELFFGWP